MIIVILKLIFFTVCFVWGVKIATEPGMAFEKIGEWARNKVDNGNKIFDPLLTCPFCMPSIYSMFAYLMGYFLGIVKSWPVLIAYPVVVCGSSLVIGITWMIFQLIISVKNYFDSLNGEAE